MKEKRAEELYLALSGVGDDLLREAEEAGGAKEKISRRRGIVRIAAAMAACLLLIVGIGAVLPMLKKDVGIPEWLTETEAGKITCYDEVNYYGAKVLLMREAGMEPVPSGNAEKTSSLSAPVFRFLAGEEKETERDDLFYYEIDPAQPIRIKKIAAFRMRLIEPEGFLASLIGTGLVDVIITENDVLETMITFRAGDRYYTCLENGNGPTCYQFSTHKYIEGYNVVKNFRQVNYSFEVTLDGRQVTGFSSSLFGGTDYVHRPDTAVIIEDSCCVRKVSGTFTVSELERFLGGTREQAGPAIGTVGWKNLSRALRKGRKKG